MERREEEGPRKIKKEEEAKHWNNCPINLYQTLLMCKGHV